MNSGHCAFTGHRPEKLPWKNDETSELFLAFQNILHCRLKSLIENGFHTFYTGMARGIDTICAECILNLKHDFPNIKLIAVIPHRKQSYKWSEQDKSKYNNILSKCDDSVLISENYSKNCMFKRNDYLVSNSNIVLAVLSDQFRGGTIYTLNKAQSLNKNIIIINPNDLKTYFLNK